MAAWPWLRYIQALYGRQWWQWWQYGSMAAWLRCRLCMVDSGGSGSSMAVWPWWRWWLCMGDSGGCVWAPIGTRSNILSTHPGRFCGTSKDGSSASLHGVLKHLLFQPCHKNSSCQRTPSCQQAFMQ
eukprot:747317-Pelagomonas_calceolata.AAC.9